ncbi:MAG: hypothetical protein R3F62_00200 [Planctomycetota bacterium]
MSDLKLQRLERRWRASQSLADEVEYLRERVRVGELPLPRLQLAAYLEHPAARAVLPDFALPPGYRTWLTGLGAWSDRLALRAYALILAELAGDERAAHRDYFQAAAQELARGERPSNEAASAFFREHGAEGERGGWQLALGSFSRPRCYLPPEHPERLAARGKLHLEGPRPGPLGSALPPLDPADASYRRSEGRHEGWFHEFVELREGRPARLLRPVAASPGWSPPPGFEGAPPGLGLLDTLRWDLPDTPALREVVRRGLAPDALGYPG